MRDSRAFDESSFRAERSAALCAAARSGHIDCVQALLRFSDTSLANRAVNGTTPLVAAVRGKRRDVVCALLDAGAAVDTRAGETPLTAAIWHRSDAIVQLLLEQGADVERTNAFDQPPLWVAVQCNNAHAAQTLLDCGASANCAATLRGVAGMTALQTAVLNGSASFAHMLLRAGALVDAANDNCQTALQIAVESGSVEMVRLLILANANVHSTAMLFQRRSAFAASFAFASQRCCLRPVRRSTPLCFRCTSTLRAKSTHCWWQPVPSLSPLSQTPL
jgi:ankyrin repeat protein